VSIDNKLEIDESRRLAEHEAVKSTVAADVRSEIAAEAGGMTAAEQQEAAAVAARMKSTAINEVAGQEEEVHRSRGAARVSQVVDYVFFVIYGLIGLEIILELLGARQGAGFKQFIDALTMPLLAPFRGLLPTPSAGPMQLMLSFIFALVVYLFLHLAINGLLRMAAHRKLSV
jgi:uncharacterized protein YggT (Ycf19 family)